MESQNYRENILSQTLPEKHFWARNSKKKNSKARNLNRNNSRSSKTLPKNSKQKIGVRKNFKTQEKRKDFWAKSLRHKADNYSIKKFRKTKFEWEKRQKYQNHL